jgi:hypothetical protein
LLRRLSAGCCEWRAKFDWAEPGDRRPPNYEKVRAKPLPRAVSYPSLTAEAELELIRGYHDTGDKEALKRLVGAHRPMVVRMAKHMWRTGVPLNVLVEYGMLGLPIAAQPPRPSKTKKGAMVGFDPSTGNRFGTYARPYAAKEMRAAIADDVYEPLVKPEFEQKATVEFEEWSTAESLKGPLPPILRHLRERRASPPVILRWTLWNPPTWAKDQYERKVHLRNYSKHPATDTQWANKDAFYGVWSDALKTLEQIAKDGMKGWGDTGRDWNIENDFMLASLHEPRVHWQGVPASQGSIVEPVALWLQASRH